MDEPEIGKGKVRDKGSVCVCKGGGGGGGIEEERG